MAESGVSTKARLHAKVDALSDEAAAQLLASLDSQDLIAEGSRGDGRSIWDVLARIAEQIPDEELERLPRDGAIEHDHYIHGTPKRYS